jgi:hypothetical protein
MQWKRRQDKGRRRKRRKSREDGVWRKKVEVKGAEGKVSREGVLDGG